MPINVRWDDEAKTIVRLDFIAPVSWETFQDAMDRAAKLAESVNYRVDVLSIPGVVPMPPGSPVPQVQRAFKKLPRNVGVVVMLTSNAFARTIVSTVGGMYIGKRYKAVETIDEAYRLIDAHRAKSHSAR
ncbi:MAG: hypothetical protein ABI690_35175 [Chloroflexota bacterium]